MHRGLVGKIVRRATKIGWRFVRSRRHSWRIPTSIAPGCLSRLMCPTGVYVWSHTVNEPQPTINSGTQQFEYGVKPLIVSPIMATLAPTIRFESLVVDTMHHQLFHIAHNFFSATGSDFDAKSYVGSHPIIWIPTETILSTSNYTLSPVIRYPGTNDDSLSQGCDFVHRLLISIARTSIWNLGAFN